QGLAAAAIIAGAAVAYSASASDAPQNAVSAQAPQASPDTGYIQPDSRPSRALISPNRHRYGKDKHGRDDHARPRHQKDSRDDHGYDDCGDDREDHDDRRKRRPSRSHDRDHDRH